MRDPAGEDRIVVIGAGIAGLSAARALAAAGLGVVVLERAKGVGGRCATRRIEGGQPVDFGVSFLHGRDPELLAALAEVPGGALPGWPSKILGEGRPCQPDAFAEGARRVAFVDGVAAFPRHLARGLDVRTQARVTGLEVSGASPSITLTIDDAAPIAARTVILALAVEQSLALLASIGSRAPGLDTVSALLTMMPTRPCLTVYAVYPPGVPGPPFHVSYPEDSSILQLIAHDSSKRVDPASTVMVYQAHPRWSREQLDLDPPREGVASASSEPWARALLAEAARLLGPWAAAPSSLQAHRWKHARTDGGAELSAPILLHFPGYPGPRLGFAGELFAPSGGVEAAWVSGVRLARMILAEDMR